MKRGTEKVKCWADIVDEKILLLFRLVAVSSVNTESFLALLVNNMRHEVITIFFVDSVLRSASIFFDRNLTEE